MSVTTINYFVLLNFLIFTTTIGFNLNLKARGNSIKYSNIMNQKSASSLRFAFDENVPGSDYFISPIMNSKERDEPLDPLIFGLWKVSCDIAEEVVYNAIREGYRRFDSATDYGNEVAVGKGIQRAINEGVVKRSDLFITSKLWNTYHNPMHVEEALDRNLKDLGLDYLDAYLIHFPVALQFVPFDQKYPPEWTNMEGKMVIVPNDISQTWVALEKCYHNNKVRNLGLSNFAPQLIRQIEAIASVKPAVMQNELHCENTQESLIRFGKEFGMRVEAYSPFGASSYRDLPFHLGKTGVTTTRDAEMMFLIKNPVVTNIAKKVGKSPHQVLLRFALQRGTCPISKTTNVERMRENRNVFDFQLPDEDMNELRSLNRNVKYNDPLKYTEQLFDAFCPIFVE